jgi:hypothetical protein
MRRHLPAPHADWNDPWRTEVALDEPGEVRLDELLREAAAQPQRLSEQDRAQIAVNDVPAGFRTITDQLSRELRTSYSILTRHSVQLGMDRLDSTLWIARVRHAYDEVRSGAMSGGDRESLARLDQPEPFVFQAPQPRRTTLTVAPETAARVGKLAMVCALTPGELGVLAAVVGLLTLPNNRGYRDGLIEEVEAFERRVARRTRHLLGEPAPRQASSLRRPR